MRFRYRPVPQLKPTSTPGLFEQVTGKPLPSYRELRAIYGDPADLPPILPRHQEALGMLTAAQAVERVNEAAAVLRDAVGVSASDVGKVDFRDMLKDDAPAWSVRARFERVLGRPYLATALADQLDPATAVALADRLTTLVSQAVAEAELAIGRDVAAAVSVKVQEMRASRTSRTEAVTHERFGRTTRLD